MLSRMSGVTPARRSPTMFTPRTSAGFPSTMKYGGTSCPIREHPLTMASVPIRTN